MTVELFGNFIMCRSAYNYVIQHNPAIPLQIVSNANLDLSIDASMQIDYQYYKVNPYAGEETGLNIKNQIRFNISPPIKDWFEIDRPVFKGWTEVGAMTNDMDTNVYCLVQMDVKRNGSKYITPAMGFPDTSIGEDTFSVAFNGYQDFTSDNELINIGNPYNATFPTATILLDNNYESDYYSGALSSHGGNIFLYTFSAIDVVYTNLRTGATQTATLLAEKLQQVPSVHPSYVADGNKVEFKSGSTVLSTATFRPKSECKYDVVVCDYIGKYGVWKRTYFYKASYDNLEVKGTDFIGSTYTIDNYGVFDINGKSNIKVNTDWVDEYFNNDLKEMMLSERILLDNKVVKIKTKATELQKNINNKLINYTLEFDYCKDEIRKDL
jgi:hypothetical protein